MHDFALDGRHRLELDRPFRRDRPFGTAQRERLEGRLAAGAVAGRVHNHLLAPVDLAAPDDRVHQVLNCVDGLPVLADHEPELAAHDRRDQRLVVFAQGDLGSNADPLEDPLEHSAHLSAELRVLLRRFLFDHGARVDRRDHARGRVADAQ